ncbi:hypothetical protein N9N32_00180 [Alphaproteobacteria bacterium]|nr:hypothetical protein [Alphaproteobacteria bacterium]
MTDNKDLDKGSGKPATEVSAEGLHGGTLNRGGRPKGSKSIYSKESVKKLQELGYDPIEELVGYIREVDEALAEMADSKKGTAAHAQLMNNKFNAINALMRYGYSPTALQSEDKGEQNEKTPIAITLTTASDTSTTVSVGDSKGSVDSSVGDSKPN